MRKMRLLMISILLIFSTLLLVKTDVYANAGVIVKEQTMQMQVNDDGTVSVKEFIQLDTSTDITTFNRKLPSFFTLDVDNDGNVENYEFSYTNIAVENLDSKVSTSENDLLVEITLNQQSQISLEYTIVLPTIMKDAKPYLFYSFFSSYQDHIIEKLSITMNFSKALAYPLNVTLFDINHVSQGGFIEFSQTETSVVITSKQAIPSHTLLQIQGEITPDYFTYKTLPDYQLYSIFISLIFIVVISYLIFYFILIKNTKGKKMFYPPLDIPVPFYGYILDKEILPQDLFAQVIVWANEGYVDIIQKKDEIILSAVKSFENTSLYEQKLSDLIFMGKNSVNINDLKNQNIESGLKETCSLMVLKVLQFIKKPIYVNASKHLHFLYSISAAVPMTLLAAASAFTLTGRYSEALRFAVLTLIIVLCSVFPLHFIVRQKEAITKSKAAILNVLIIFWIAILWSALVIFLLQNGTNIVYLTIVSFISILFIFILLYATKRTKYGKLKHYELSHLKHFMGFVKKPHLLKLLDNDSNYFFEMLPVSYIYGNVKDWCSKFQTIHMVQPDWFYSDVNDKPWLQQLEIVLQDLYSAITNDKESK